MILFPYEKFLCVFPKLFPFSSLFLSCYFHSLVSPFPFPARISTLGAAADLWCAHLSCMYNVFPNRVEFKVHSLFALIFPSVCFGNFLDRLLILHLDIDLLD